MSEVIHSRRALRHIAQHRLPPGPRGEPLLGNLRDMARDSLGFLMKSALTYGDVVRFRFLSEEMILINHPDHIKHVLQDNNHNYDKDTFDYRLLKIAVGNGLLTSDGDTWLRQRRLIQPAFHRQRLVALGTLMTDSTQALLDQWQAESDRGQPVDIAHEMMRLTLRIVGRALFSIDISSEADEFGQAFTVVNKYLTDRFYNLLPLPLSFPTPNNRRAQTALHTLNRVVQEIIDERRAGGDGKDDLLSMLLQARDAETGQGMNDRQVRDEVMTILLAGHETTANALSWTWYLLSKHPTVAHRHLAELDRVLGGRPPTVEDLTDLPYNRMVIEEAMRLYPPAWAISRKAIADDQIEGYTIPANSIVFMSAYTMHRHPAFWENPEGFDPERFTPERSAERPQFAYFPFGGGPRLCIGSNFAMQEAQLLLATIARQYRLELVPGHNVVPEPLITLRPRGGLPMWIRPR
jgi:cytochrome P450